jgi:putative peptidoglycan lipid II flippase
VSESVKPKRSLVNIAGIVAVATLISKVFGMVRQMAIAAAFGVGAAVDAYNYAYILPGFLFVLLGGINGPFHSAIISVLSKRPKEDAAPLVETVTTLVGLVLLGVTIAQIIFAAPLVQIFAPGASPEVKQMAVEQLRIMAPMAFFSGLIGIGFGTLNAAEHYWLPSISPLFSSVTVIIGIWFFKDQFGPAVIAWGTLVGAVLQWLVQIPSQWKSGMGTLRPRFDFNRPGVDDIWKLMGPATFSSGMLLISVSISLFFASLLPVGAASALGYAQLLFLTPLGILSNVVLVPLMPIFSRLAAPENWDEFKRYLRQGLIVTALTMLPMGALISALALPAVRMIYEYSKFTAQDSQMVAGVLFAYGIGMFFYLGRDILVRAFYGLGDGDTPFKVSLWGLVMNAVFCFLFTKTFGAPGLALATAGVNMVSMVILMWVLHRRMNGLPWRDMLAPIGKIALASIAVGFITWAILLVVQLLWVQDGKLMVLVQLAIAGGSGVGLLALILHQLKLPEVQLLLDRVLKRGKPSTAS